MRKLWLVAKHTYRERVRTRSFLFTTFGLPLLMVAVMGVSILVTLGGIDDRPLGYVDGVGFLDPAVMDRLREQTTLTVDIRPFSSEDAAQEALEVEEIQAYYVVPEDYLESQEVLLYYWDEEPDSAVLSDFDRFMRANLVEMQSEEVAAILSEGLDLTIQSADGRKSVSSGNILSFLLPFFMAFFLFFSITVAGGYMLQAVTEEKENRMVEILTTSISPFQIMGGKALGLIAVSLTQLTAWVATLTLLALVGSYFIPQISVVSFPWEAILVALLYFLPTFALMAGFMTALGAAVAEQQQGQQITGIVNMLFIFPVFFSALIFANPNSPFLVFLTLFPTTAFTTIMLRWGLSSIPLWQMVASWILLVLVAAGSVWVAARVFRMGMLRYGQRLKLQAVLAGLFGSERAA
ncbi:MAG: ABC transporter permease [Anaerolineales bacterium]